MFIRIAATIIVVIIIATVWQILALMSNFSFIHSAAERRHWGRIWLLYTLADDSSPQWWIQNMMMNTWWLQVGDDEEHDDDDDDDDVDEGEDGTEDGQ